MHEYNHGKHCGQCHDGACNIGKAEDDVQEQQCDKNRGLYKNDVCGSGSLLLVHLMMVGSGRTADLGCSRVLTVEATGQLITPWFKAGGQHKLFARHRKCGGWMMNQNY